MYRYIQEDKREHYTFLLSMVPIARTPLDKDGGRAMEKYSKSVEKMVESLTPWDVTEKRSSWRGRVKSGEVVVIADDPDDNLNDPLYKGAKILKHGH